MGFSRAGSNPARSVLFAFNTNLLEWSMVHSLHYKLKMISLVKLKVLSNTNSSKTLANENSSKLQIILVAVDTSPTHRSHPHHNRHNFARSLLQIVLKLFICYTRWNQQNSDPPPSLIQTQKMKSWTECISQLYRFLSSYETLHLECILPRNIRLTQKCYFHTSATNIHSAEGTLRLTRIFIVSIKSPPKWERMLVLDYKMDPWVHIRTLTHRVAAICKLHIPVRAHSNR